MSKHHAIPNPATKTAVGTFLVAADRQRIYSSFRYAEMSNAKDCATTEAQRLADTLPDCDRVLVLQVVAVRKAGKEKVKNTAQPIDKENPRVIISVSQAKENTLTMP